jgi:hypothetical protein
MHQFNLLVKGQKQGGPDLSDWLMGKPTCKIGAGDVKLHWYLLNLHLLKSQLHAKLADIFEVLFSPYIFLQPAKQLATAISSNNGK